MLAQQRQQQMMAQQRAQLMQQQQQQQNSNQIVQIQQMPQQPNQPGVPIGQTQMTPVLVRQPMVQPQRFNQPGMAFVGNPGSTPYPGTGEFILKVKFFSYQTHLNFPA